MERKIKNVRFVAFVVSVMMFVSLMPISAFATLTNDGCEHTYNDKGFCEICDFPESAVILTEDNLTDYGVTDKYIGYYAISNAGQLYWFADYIDEYDGTEHVDAVLTADIVVNENVLTDSGELSENSEDFMEWNPIGWYDNVTWDLKGYYEGTFDGNNHSISGLYFNNPEENFVALFSFVGMDSCIKNVTLTDTYFNGGTDISGICSIVYNYRYAEIEYFPKKSRFENCVNNGTIKAVGGASGICGGSSVPCTIAGCINNGDISGKTAGGISISCDDNTVIETCINNGNITSTGQQLDYGKAAGITASSSGVIEGCVNTGAVFSYSEAGGIVGRVDDGTVTKCRNDGAISTTAYSVGGVVGCVYNHSSGIYVTDCYNTGDISGDMYVGGIIGEAGRYSSNEGGWSYNMNLYNIGSVTGNRYVGAICGIVGDYGQLTNSFYLKESAVKNDGTVVTGLCWDAGTTNAQYNEFVVDDSYECATGVTNEHFSSGEIAYKLNKCKSNGDLVWYQNLEKGEEKHSYPSFKGNVVYYIDNVYTNIPVEENHDHVFVDGFCTYKDCTMLESPAEITQLNYGDYNLAEAYIGYYAVYNAGQMYWLVENFSSFGGDKNIVLLNDIVLNENVLDPTGVYDNGDGDFRDWIPIGNEELKYSGIFDGNGKTISGFYHKLSFDDFGMFGYCDGAIVKKLSIDDSYFVSTENVGVFCGNAVNSTFENCHTTSRLRCLYGYSGGVCGWAYNTIFRNCTNSGIISAENAERCGGILGSGSEVTIEDCYNTGRVTVDYSMGGGIAGSVVDASVITGCYNSGIVLGYRNNVGGICGYMRDSLVEESYNIGEIKSNKIVGGVCGYIASGTVRDCYNNGDVICTISRAGGIAGNIAGSDSTVESCYNIGVVTGPEQIGGVFCGLGDGATANNCFYLMGCAYDTDNNLKTGVYDDCSEEQLPVADAVGVVESVSKERFASGEITYLLNNYASSSESVWKQTIEGDGDLQPYPLYTGNIVYKVKDVLGRYHFSNKNEVIEVVDEHTYDNGICTECGAYQVPYINDDNVYEINNAGKLYWFAGVVNGTLTDETQNKTANAILTGDIIINENVFADDGALTDDIASLRVWVPIGNSSNKFGGTFDGQNYAISGLYLSDTAATYTGLVGYGEKCEIKNIGVIDSYLNASSYLGAVCGYLYNGKIYNCFNDSVIVGTKQYTGGVCGYIAGSNSIKKNCHNTGTVSGATYTGGVFGMAYGDSVNCSNKGTVTGTGNYTGGVLAQSSGIAENMSNSGAVSGAQYTGGICGDGSVQKSRNTGSVTGANYTGGIVGNTTTCILNCVNGATVNGNYYVGGVCGRANGGDVTNSVNTDKVTGKGTVGGICGEISSEAVVSNCNNSGAVEGTTGVGGVCGAVKSSSVLSCCYNNGNVTGNGTLGGVCGSTHYANVENCYNTGMVTGSTYTVGGICGNNGADSLVYASYNIGAISGKYNVGSVCGSVNTTSKTINCYYLEDCAVDIADKTQNGIGNATQGSATDDVDGVTYETTEKQFNSGKITVALNGAREVENQLWGQNIDNGKTVQNYPSFDGEAVYVSDNKYTNIFEHTHTFVNGMCTFLYCTEYEPAEVITADNFDGYGLSSSYIGYYAVSNAGQLYWFAGLVNGTLDNISQNTLANAVLVKDVTVNESVLNSENSLMRNIDTYKTWEPIGNSENNYCGVFDGAAHEINGLVQATGDYVGLFGCVSDGAVIKNITLSDSWFSGSGYVSGICAYSDGGEFVNCITDSVINCSADYCGGICAYADNTSFEKCKTDGVIVGEGSSHIYVGGICGYLKGKSSVVAECSNNSSVTVQSGTPGGICGYAQDAVIRGCSNYAVITIDIVSGGSSNGVGGIAGCINNVYIKDCMNGANITSDAMADAGGVCGYMKNNSIIEKSYNNSAVESASHYSDCGGLCGEAISSEIVNCYNVGAVQNKYTQSTAGGLLGKGSTASMNNCYNYGSVSNQNGYSGGIIGSNSSCAISACYYLEGCAVDGNSTLQNGVGNASNGEVTADVSGATISTTADEFASGKIAYALQSAINADDTTGIVPMVWGQMNNAEGSTPVLTSNRYYEVYKNGNGDYLVGVKGDINGDDAVDVADYQTVVNMIFEDDSQSEETQFRADVNGDAVVDALDAAAVSLLANGIS